MDPTNPLKEGDDLTVFYPGVKVATEEYTRLIILVSAPTKIKRDRNFNATLDDKITEERVRRDVPQPYSYKVPNDVPQTFSYKAPKQEPLKASVPEEPLWVRQVSQCRVIVAKGGDVHKRCDRIAESRPLDYQTAITLFPPGTDLSHDASDFDLFEF